MNRPLAGIVLALAMLGCAGSCRSEGVAQAKASPQWLQVTVTGAATLVAPDEVYVQEPNRTAGIRVECEPPEGVSVGDTVTATGTLALVGGELSIVDGSVAVSGDRFELRPLGMATRSIGGAQTFSSLGICDYLVVDPLGEEGPRREWVPSGGLCNTGLLVRTWGTVTAVYHSPITGARWFYVDDGFGAVSDYGDIGVLVYSDSDVRQGQYVSVTGVSSVEPSFDSPQRLVRVIRTRDAEDVSTHREAPVLEYPFSDEFDGPTLSPMWDVQEGGGGVSAGEQRFYVLARLGSSGDFRSDYITLAGIGYSGSQDAHRYWWRDSNTATGDSSTSYLRVRREPMGLYSSYSLDGASYSQDSFVPFQASTFIVLSASWITDQPQTEQFLALVDYFRVTPAGEQGAPLE